MTCLEETKLAPASQPSLLGVPGETAQFDAIGHAYLLAQIQKHLGPALFPLLRLEKVFQSPNFWTQRKGKDSSFLVMKQ
jgi:hypothetical protein